MTTSGSPPPAAGREPYWPEGDPDPRLAKYDPRDIADAEKILADVNYKRVTYNRMLVVTAANVRRIRERYESAEASP